MPAHADRVGQQLAPFTITCDARWLMSYAAGIGVTDERYLDTTRHDGIVGHPVFPVAPEWALITSPTRFDTGMTRDETARGVHAAHDLILHRPVHQDETVTIAGELAGVEHTRTGARVTLRFRASDSGGAPIWDTAMTMLHLDVDVEGVDRPPRRTTPPSNTTSVDEATAANVVSEIERPISAGAAHVYTECARIFNPIHTDRTVARQTGLPDIVLHGTASLAIGVQTVLDELDVDPASVGRLGGSFRRMVLMPTTLTIAVHEPTIGDGTSRSRFDVLVGDQREAAVRDGFVEYRSR